MASPVNNHHTRAKKIGFEITRIFCWLAQRFSVWAEKSLAADLEPRSRAIDYAARSPQAGSGVGRQTCKIARRERSLSPRSAGHRKYAAAYSAN
jgi:hypothetical protein